MPCLIYTATGKFAGNCLPNEIPPLGQSYVTFDFPEGMNDPHFIEGQWVDGELPNEYLSTEPQYSKAWQEITTSAVYQSVDFLALTDLYLSHCLNRLSLAFSGWRDSDPMIWKIGVSSAFNAVYHRLEVINEPLTSSSKTWLSDWQTRNNLGLNFDWEIT